MKSTYFHEQRHSELLKNIEFYHRVDLLLKLSFSLVLFLILFLIGFLSLAIGVFTFLLTLKIIRWLFARFLQYALKKWYDASLHQLVGDKISHEKLGSYRLPQLAEWIAELGDEVGVSHPAELILYDSKQANASANQERWFGFIKRNRMILLANMLHLLNEDELKAVIVHELGHHKHYPRVGIIVQILIPLLTERLTYRWSLEHLSDWYAARIVGVVPTANALIKIHHRGHLMREIAKGLQFVQKDFKIGFAGAAEFQEIVNKVIPDKIKADENLDQYMIRVIDKYFERRSPKLKGLGKSQIEKYRKESKTERRVLKSRYKLIDWRVFDNRVKDNYLDENELEELYIHLKENENVRFFYSYIEKDRELEKWSSHPSLRDRLMYIVETTESEPDSESKS